MKYFKYVSMLFMVLLGGLILSSCNSKIDILSELYSTDEGRWLNELTSPKYKGRKVGTNESLKIRNYLIAELRNLGYNPNVQSFVFKESIEMHNIIVEIPGDNDSIVVIGAHYDGAVYSESFPAADDNASGVVTLLSIAKSISHTRYTTKLCFWDGEEYTISSAFNGSNYFLQNNIDIEKIRWYCNIDCCGRMNDDILLYYSPHMQDQCINAFSLVEPIDNMHVNVQYKIQESSGSDYVSFRNVGIPYWGWNDVNTLLYNHTIDDSADKISIYKLQYVSSTILRMLAYL